MKFNNESSHIYIHDKSIDEKMALSRITHLGVGAHQDDVEIIGSEGIVNCRRKDGNWFGAIVATDGGGAARGGQFLSTLDNEMREIRKKEQIEAASIGNYSATIQLGYMSSDIKDLKNNKFCSDLISLLMIIKPEVIYTHNMFDKHDTHIAVCTNLITSLRSLDKKFLPKKVFGVEVWRGLDWINDSNKVQLDISGEESFILSQLGVYKSQIEGGKRYDLATIGRMRANATYSESHVVDNSDLIVNAVDLTPLILNKKLDIKTFTKSYLDSFRKDVLDRLNKFI